MQEQQGLRPVLLRLLRNVVLVDVAIFGIAGLVCWLIGWRTWFQYGRVLVIAGAVCALVGISTMLGGVRSREPQYYYVDSMGQPSSYERTKRLVLDAHASYRFTILMGLAGLIAALVGIVIAYVVIGPVL